IRPGGQALVDGVFMRTARAWAIARIDGSVEVGPMPPNRAQRVPVVRVLVGLVAALRLAIGRGMLRRGRTRAANRRLLLALVAAEVATVLVAMAGGSLAGALWPVLANGAAVVVALVALRVVAPASLWRMHGAEHKAVAAYEVGLDLSDLDAVLGAPRVHDRCGTNVVFLMVGAGVPLLWLPGMVQAPAFLLALAVAAEVVTSAAGRPGAPLRRRRPEGGGRGPGQPSRRGWRRSHGPHPAVPVQARHRRGRGPRRRRWSRAGAVVRSARRRARRRVRRLLPAVGRTARRRRHRPPATAHRPQPCPRPHPHRPRRRRRRGPAHGPRQPPGRARPGARRR